MLTDPEKLTVSVDGHGDVTALLYGTPKKNRTGMTILLGHGAGANQMSAFMRLFANGLATRGFDAMTFNFLYSEKGRGGPDPKAKLESCYRAVIEAASSQRKLKGNRLVIGGKSMGGRIASQVAADDSNGIDGLVFLGYPLHPPGKPEQTRDAHLKDIQAPLLFIQGSRDAFGAADEIRVIIKRDRLKATLYPIDGGDHSFKVPKSSDVSQQQVYELMLDEIARWVRERVD